MATDSAEPRLRSPTGPLVAVLAGAAAASYWTFMSPYSQALGTFPYRPQTDDPVVALTFDDGPNDPHTSRLADLLAERGVLATFFAVGTCIERHPETARRLLNDGHVLGSHSYSHTPRRCVGRRRLEEEIGRNDEVFSHHLGLRPALYRPPWLFRTGALFEVARERSLQLVSGEFAHVLEVFQPSPERLAGRAAAKARPGSVLIFHDGREAKGGDRANTVAAVGRLVDRLSSGGYRFTTVDRLLGVSPYLEPAG